MELHASIERDIDTHWFEPWAPRLVPSNRMTLTVYGDQELVGPLADLVWEGIEKLKADQERQRREQKWR